MTTEKLYNMYKNAYTNFLKAKKGSPEEAHALFKLSLTHVCAKTDWLGFEVK